MSQFKKLDQQILDFIGKMPSGYIESKGPKFGDFLDLFLPNITKWSIDDKQTVVQAQCSVCKIIYKERQAQNDCIQVEGYYWVVGKECLHCYVKRVEKN